VQATDLIAHGFKARRVALAGFVLLATAFATQLHKTEREEA
jgi:hypothetical protein